MTLLQITNREQRPLAQITWEPPDTVTLKIFALEHEAALTAFIENAWHNGVPFRTATQMTEDGQTIYLMEEIVVKPNDERFLHALADESSSYTLAGERIFGLIRPPDAKGEPHE
jgi:hypothetical protein